MESLNLEKWSQQFFCEFELLVPTITAGGLNTNHHARQHQPGAQKPNDKAR
jgi:hypothetical protein